MAIKIGSTDISDIQVNQNGTLTPVNIVKIGGASTNIWERSTGDHSNTGIWANDDYTFAWDEDTEYFEYYGYDWCIRFFVGRWTLSERVGTRAFVIESINGSKTDSEITFDNVGTLSWRAS